MKTLLTFVLICMLALLPLFSASAEQATLTYSYGDDAFNKHMLSVMNTVDYKGKTYVFDFGGLEFDDAFMMYGGNTRTVFEFEVPKFQLDIHPQDKPLLLGTVTITAPRAMSLFVFSGDRTSGQYTLIDSKTNEKTYRMDVYANRDESGTLRLIDKVFLYSYQDGGKEVHYAASLYVAYERYAAAPAEGAPAKAASAAKPTEVPVADPAAELAN